MNSHVNITFRASDEVTVGDHSTAPYLMVMDDYGNDVTLHFESSQGKEKVSRAIDNLANALAKLAAFVRVHGEP